MNQSDKIRLIVVDDHETIRRTLCLFFAQVEFVELVAVARNGHEAIDLCEQYQPDVVLMDIVMPEMDGIDAIKAIHERCPSIRIVGMTGMQHRHLEPDVLQAGAVDLLIKGAPVDCLLNAISVANQHAADTDCSRH